MLTEQEINVLFHILDCVGPDLVKTDYCRWELKPPDYREYLDTISLSENEYKTFAGLKNKLRGALFSSMISGKGQG